jgi:hypothetical protein
MPSFSTIIAGLTILAKYEPKGLDSWGVAAEHDTIYAGGTPPRKMSDEDRKELYRLGWHWDDEVESWCRFC